MTVPTFTAAASGSGLYYLDGAAAATGLPSYAAAFLSPAAVTPGSTLTLEQSWAVAGGTYLFLNSTPTDESAFVSAVRQFLRVTANVRVIWLDDPNAPLSMWSPETLTVAGGTVGTQNVFAFRNYRLSIGGSCAVSLTNDQTSIQIVQPSAGAISFTPGSGAISIDGNTVLLPFAGTTLGCLGFPMTLAASASNDGTSDIDRMDVGLRYYFDDEANPGYLLSLRYRVFDTTQQPMALAAALDPINPLVVTRTLFGLFTGSAQSLASYFLSWVGLPATLTANNAGNPALVFAPNPSTTSGDPADPYYLVPSGTFAVTVPPAPVPGSGPAGRLLLGTSAIEYAGFSAASGNTLSFVSGQNAYAPGFATGADPGPGGGPPLQAGATTSWLYPGATTQGQTVSYFTQPERSALYHLTASATDPKSTYLGYMELVSRVLPPSTASSFPAVPYGNLADLPNGAHYAGFEARVLAPARLEAVAALPSALPAAPSSGSFANTGTTRHGFLAQFDATLTTWQSLRLAQSAAGAETLTIAGANGGAIAGTLRDALLAGQQFLVLAGSRFAQNASLPGSRLTIEQFGFDLDPAVWGGHNTIIVIKYADGTVYDLTADLASWTDTRTFNDGTLTQRDLVQIYKDADARAATNPDFAPFAALIHDPAWNGILALNVTVPPASFPPELAALVAGIDMSLFSAHHIGVSLSPVVMTGTTELQLSMQDSSLFGLIYYDVGDTPFAQDGSTYRYRVASLRVVFENSRIARFASTVQLMLNSLFSEPATLLRDPGGDEPQNTISLHGSYQESNGVKSYAFLTEEDHVFRMRSAVLEEVELTRGQFLTLTTAADLAAGKDVLSRFAFWGTMRFRALADFDLFSYDRLSFTNLSLDMSFAQANPAQLTFLFNAQQLAVNVATSIPRAESLVRRFPVTFQSFVQAQEGSSPASLGYHAVVTPVPESGLIYPWYALLFELKLGSLGALAGKAGFSAELLAAWSPNEAGISMFTGLKIPGTGASGKLFSIESILRVSIDNFQFVTGESATGGLSYTLALTNIRLVFMGKQLPPSAYIDFILFGDPGGSGDTLGWYASYTADEDPQPKRKGKSFERAAARRQLMAPPVEEVRH